MSFEIDLCPAHCIGAKTDTDKKKKRKEAAKILVQKVNNLVRIDTPLGDALKFLGLTEAKFEKLKMLAE